MLVIARESPDQPEVARLFRLADERSRALYPEDDRSGMSLAAILSAETRFFVARVDGAAVGCGGTVRIAEGSAEIKRLFVDPEARGIGVGGKIVQAIEGSVREEGFSDLFLETGIQSHEALRLYRRLGFAVCEPFGHYGRDPLSVFMSKSLAGETLPR